MAERDLPTFADNFNRLLGLHRLSQHSTAHLLNVSEATMSAWMTGKSQPSLRKAIAIAQFFRLSTDALMGTKFVQLLQNELADPTRFKEVEKSIGR